MSTNDQQLIVLSPDKLQEYIKTAVRDVLGPLLDREKRNFLTQSEVRKLTGHHNDKLNALVDTGVLKRGGGRRNYRYEAADVYAYLRGEKDFKQGQRIPETAKKKNVTKIVRGGERIYR